MQKNPVKYIYDCFEDLVRKFGFIKQKNVEMLQENVVKYIYDCFEDLVEKFGLTRQNEINEGQTFSVDFCAKTFAVKLEKYRREFYATLYRVDRPDYEINLYNIIQYLNQSSSNVPEPNYFVDEDDIEECYRKQIKHIASNISDYFPQLDEFFNHEKYDSELEKLNRFLQEQDPELFGES